MIQQSAATKYNDEYTHVNTKKSIHHAECCDGCAQAGRVVVCNGFPALHHVKTMGTPGSRPILAASTNRYVVQSARGVEGAVS